MPMKTDRPGSEDAGLQGRQQQKERTNRMNVKIFVSHRIDLDAELIDNPIYVPVRCGAVYDQRKGVTMQGDDTGDSISQKRMSFCEFTVQYWAWKNAQADYMGLCHYRRYLSFAEHHSSKVNAHNMVEVPMLTERVKRRFGLLDAARMTREIAQVDAVVPEPAPVERIPTYTGAQAHTVRQLWEEHAGIFVDRHCVDTLLKLIERMKPEYAQSAQRYFAGDRHIGYNCYVMKAELFNRLCEFQFPILFELERVLPKETLEQYPRMIGYMGEMLFGVFVYRLTEEQCNIGYRQIVFVEEAEKYTNEFLIIFKLLWLHAKRLGKNGFDFSCPVGSKRRVFLKRVVKQLNIKRG